MLSHSAVSSAVTRYRGQTVGQMTWRPPSRVPLNVLTSFPMTVPSTTEKSGHGHSLAACWRANRIDGDGQRHISRCAHVGHEISVRVQLSQHARHGLTD